MSKFMEIIAIQPPIDIGVDPSNRSMFSTNYRASVSLYSGKIEREILYHLQSKGLSVSFDSNGNLLTVGYTGTYGSKAVIPSGAGPYIQVKLTGGYTPKFTQDNNREINVTFQITCWSISYDVSLLKSVQIHDELNGKRDLEVTV